jgi:hypothetical protein
MATLAAQLYLYLLFPPFATVFQIYNWYGLAPYFAATPGERPFSSCARKRFLYSPLPPVYVQLASYVFSLHERTYLTPA